MNMRLECIVCLEKKRQEARELDYIYYISPSLVMRKGIREGPEGFRWMIERMITDIADSMIYDVPLRYSRLE